MQRDRLLNCRRQLIYGKSRPEALLPWRRGFDRLFALS
jgi:hypothetical protein